MVLRERCTCGAEFEFSTEDFRVARDLLEEWRSRHHRARCGSMVSTEVEMTTTARVGKGGKKSK